MSLFGWICSIVAAVVTVFRAIISDKDIKEKIAKSFIDILMEGILTDDDIDQNANLIRIIEEECKKQKTFIRNKFDPIFEQDRKIFNKMIERIKCNLEQADIDYLNDMVDTTINKNQIEMERLLKDTYNIDNLKSIVTDPSKDNRREQYEALGNRLTKKIKDRFLDSSNSLYNKVFSFIKKSFNRKCRSIQNQISDIENMINDNSDDQHKAENVLIDNIQKKIICQMAIDAVESVN